MQNSNDAKVIKQRQDLKILLMQIREDPITQEEELQEFMRYGRLTRDQFQILDVFKMPTFGSEVLRNVDALFIGGSSDASVLEPEKFPFVYSCQKLLQTTVELDFPVFASCFGFQLLITALGGGVIRDCPNLEMGVYPLSLTPEALTEPLFQDLPNPFLAISGHQERASILPANVINLASSPKCPYHAIKVANRTIYGFQFHPEVDAQDLNARLIRYQTRYLKEDSHLHDILKSIRETPQANQLIAKFIDLFLLA